MNARTFLYADIRSYSTTPRRVALARTFKEAGLRSPRTQLTKVQIEISVKCGSRGGDRGSGPPLRFVRGGVLCRGLMSRRGGPKVVFNLLLSFFSGPLRSSVLYKRATYTQTWKYTNLEVPSSIFSMEQSSFLYVSLIQIMIIIQLPSPCFHERAFSYFFWSRITRFYTI